MKPDEYLDSLFSLPHMYGPKISRDRRWVAWTWFRVGPAADVFVGPTDGSTPPLRLTDTNENAFLVSWLPDSSGVIAAQDKGGNERYQLFLIEIDEPLEMSPLTEADPNFFIRGGDLHPNGRYLVYGANLDVDSHQEIEATWIYRHDIKTGERVPLARPAKGGYIWPELNADGSMVLYTRKDRHPAGRQVWLVDIEGQQDREILNFGDDVKTFASWFPNGERVLFTTELRTHRRVGALELPNGATEWLVDDPDRNIEGANVPFGSHQVVIKEVREARTKAYLLDPISREETRLVSGTGNLFPLAPLTESEWVGQFYSSNQPGDLCRFLVDTPRYNPSRTISRVWERTALAASEFSQAEAYHWSSADGLRIQGWLYRPEGRTKGTIVFVHGGPTAHSEDAIHIQKQLFARHGFVVFDPNYRGSTGFSMRFQEEIKREGWGAAEQEDIRTGIQSLIDQGIAEPGRVGITGTSYGGYSSWCAITRFPTSIVAAAAPICGMTDLVVDYESTRPDLRPYIEEMLGGSPSEVPERYFDRSPINFVSNIRGELLIVQGDRDPNVTPENVRVIREALDHAGVRYEVLNFEDEGHGIIKPKNQQVLLLWLLDFFERALA
ncbi:MAG: prolyl oligopeptidase family serine peptidase [Candidatus Promineifilaceae bacterium]|nr:prolyl oligopeptidase family serine peptidase [Candidatus Promineifilaceae bacterium]